MTKSTCHYCDSTERELRPYGPGGTWTCFPCMKAAPEREKVAEGAFGALLEANAELSGGVVVIGQPEGPQPYRPEDR